MTDLVPEALLTTEQAATYLNVAPQTLATWRSTQRLALRFYRIGRAVRYAKADLDTFLLENCAGDPHESLD